MSVQHHDADVVVIYHDILGNSLEPHGGYSAVSPTAIKEAIITLGTMLQLRIVVMLAQWRSSFGDSLLYKQLNHQLSLKTQFYPFLSVRKIRNSKSQDKDPKFTQNLHHTNWAISKNLQNLINYAASL